MACKFFEKFQKNGTKNLWKFLKKTFAQNFWKNHFKKNPKIANYKKKIRIYTKNKMEFFF